LLIILVYFTLTHLKAKKKISQLINNSDQLAEHHTLALTTKDDMLKIQEDQLSIMEGNLNKMKTDLSKSNELKDFQCNELNQKIDDLTLQLNDKNAIFSESFLVGIFTELEHTVKTTRDNILDISHSSKILTRISKNNKLEHKDIVEHLSMATSSSKMIICQLNKIQYMAKNLNQLALDQNLINLRSFNINCKLDCSWF